MAAAEHFDVLVIGAGLSGIGAACHLQTRCPGKSFAILEGRAVSGGTWDLFRYPGVRSDSDMYTLGYAFRPWREAKAIADGPAILNYIRETARLHDVERKIRYGHKAVAAACSPAPATTTTPPATPRCFPAPSASRVPWCIRSTGRRTWTIPASGW
jgi:monooxygenase